MVSSRARITRLIATILAIALSTQIAAAQGANCVKTSASDLSAAHQEMPNRSGIDGLKAATGASDSHTPVIPGCTRSMLCMNAPAMMSLTTGAVQVAHVAPPIVYGPSSLEERTLHPDSPPPKS